MDLAFSQTNGVLKLVGTFVIGFVDKNGPLGKAYEQYKKKCVFYKDATFYAVDDRLAHLTTAGFGEFSIAQTVFGMPSDFPVDEPIKPGCCEGSFVVIKAMK
ncbi:MAG TPA: hypothetical protein VL087_09625 [Nitrospirota bacterium]|nr:hypothetical protein [Nitrospirota bacterium]